MLKRSPTGRNSCELNENEVIGAKLAIRHIVWLKTFRIKVIISPKKLVKALYGLHLLSKEDLRIFSLR